MLHVFRGIEVRIFVQSCAHVSFHKFSGLISQYALLTYGNMPVQPRF